MITTWKKITGCLSVATLVVSVTSSAADELTDRADSGQAIRIGYANEVPFAYPDANNQPAGIVNTYVINVLKKMGYDNIEPVVTDWGGLIPALQSERIDIVTGGLYILNSRCQNLAFSEPMAKVSDAFIVQTGNPKGLSNYQDLVKTGETMVTGSGMSLIEQAKQDGVPESQIMQVPGLTEILAAVSAGRAAAGVHSYLALKDLASKSGGKVEVTDPSAMPERTQNWLGIGFRTADKDFVEKFNAAQKDYLGTPAMIEAVKEYGYDEGLLPGDVTTEWVCANR